MKGVPVWLFLFRGQWVKPRAESCVGDGGLMFERWIDWWGGHERLTRGPSGRGKEIEREREIERV